MILRLRTMSDVEQVLREYIREHRAGGDADPRVYLSRLDDRVDRLELEALIDAYLEHAPRARVDLATANDPVAEAVVDRVVAELDAPATWRVVLPRLRMNARLKRSELVARLAAALGLQGREAKVARYYNAMEHEQLEPDGISDRVYEALAGIVRVPVDAIRNAAPGTGPALLQAVDDAVFARLAPWDADADAVAAAPSQSPDLDWDDVDELFRGG